jgi:hypothetical protein
MFIIENNNTIKFGHAFSLKNFSTRTFYWEQFQRLNITSVLVPLLVKTLQFKSSQYHCITGDLIHLFPNDKGKVVPVLN